MSRYTRGDEAFARLSEWLGEEGGYCVEEFYPTGYYHPQGGAECKRKEWRTPSLWWAKFVLGWRGFMKLEPGEP